MAGDTKGNAELHRGRKARVKVKPRPVMGPPKPAPKSGPFGPVGRADAPITKAQKQAKKKTQKAKAQVNSRASTPAIPKLKNATPKQRDASVKLVAKSLQSQKLSRADVQRLPKVQRERANRAYGYKTTENIKLARKVVKGGQMPSFAVAKEGRPHKTLKLPGGIATVDFTAANRRIGSVLAGNPLAATRKGFLKGLKEGGIAGRAVQNLVDLPATSVTGTYLLGKELAKAAKPGNKNPGKNLKNAAGMVVDPYVATAKDPVGTFDKDPLNTFLIGRSVKGGVGRTTGAALRKGAGGDLGRRIASTKRAEKSIPNVERKVAREYSRDVITKAGQVAYEKTKAKNRKRKGGPPPTRMTDRDMLRAASEDVQAAKNITQRNVKETDTEARKALGRKPDAAVRLQAEQITNGTKADLEAYLQEAVQAAASGKLDDAALARNKDAQKQIRKALKNFDEQRTTAAARRFTEGVAARLEREGIEEGVINPKTAEPARFAGAAKRRLGASSNKKLASTKIKQAHDDAVKVAYNARKAEADAQKTFKAEQVKARIRVAEKRTSPGVKQAERAQRSAQAALGRAQRAHQADLRELGVARGRAQVGSRNVAGAAGEARARATTVPAGVNQYAAGGRGVDIAAEAARASGKAVAAARENVRAADKAVARQKEYVTQVTKARGFIAVNRARNERDKARTVAKTARDEREARRLERSAIRKADYVAGDKPVTVADVRRAIGPNGIDPAFVSHQEIPARSAALPLEPVKSGIKQNRDGVNVEQAALDLHPAKMFEQVRGAQRQIDSARAQKRMVNDWGYRVDGEVKTFRTEDDARNWARDSVENGGGGVRKETGYDFRPVKQADGRYALVPDKIAETLTEFVNEVEANKLVKAVTANWRRNVLAFNPRWFAGNVIEAALRAAIAGAGPGSYVRAKKVLDALDENTRRQVEARTIGGGHFTSAGSLNHEAPGVRELRGFGQTLKKFSEKPGPREVSALLDAYTKFVMESVNGRVETFTQTAMLGKAMKNNSLMNERILTLTREATLEAAQGLKNTATQVELGRAVDRMYGQYSKFTPDIRAAITLYTPFLSWTLNSINFLYRVLPRDHPVLVGNLAAINTSTQEQRKALGQYFDALGKTEGQVPAFLQGSIPGKDGSNLRLTRYTPGGLVQNEGASAVGEVAALFLPQISEALLNLGGKDFGGKPLQDNNSMLRNFAAAGASMLTSQVPAASQALRTAGVRMPQMRDSQEISGSGTTRFREVFDPFRYTPAKKDKKSSSSSSRSGPGVIKPVRVKPVRIKPIRITPGG